MSSDARWMALALGLAARGLGQTWPNPAVGCVLVRGDRIVGRGWTQPGGRPHAEVEALARAGTEVAGATAYVTLEPCAHTGQTGPCASALAQAGVARVVVATGDPDPRVSGRGLAMLREAGIEVVTGVMDHAARMLNAGFISRVVDERPWITLKLASTLDGRIALASGASRWITGAQARTFVHALRARHDAVMVGAGTARADDPSLDVRGFGPHARQPVRVVVDPSLSLSLISRVIASAGEQPTWLIHGSGIDIARARTLKELGVGLEEVPTDTTGALSLSEGMRALAIRGLTRVLCEGGGKLAARLIREGLVDELIVITAGKVIGAEGIPNVAGLDSTDLANVPEFVRVEARPLGPDLLTRWLSAARAGRTV